MKPKLDASNAVCVRRNGQWWEATAGDQPGPIIRNDSSLDDLVTALQRLYPNEPLVILPVVR